MIIAIGGGFDLDDGLYQALLIRGTWLGEALWEVDKLWTFVLVSVNGYDTVCNVRIRAGEVLPQR